jgi:hypothetical protein
MAATHDCMVALFRHCRTALPGDYTIVIEEFVEMCLNGDEDKWSPTRLARSERCDASLAHVITRLDEPLGLILMTANGLADDAWR